MTLQAYVMMIGLLLIALDTESRPSKYDYVIMSMVYSGSMDMETGLRITARRRRERERAAERQRQKKSKG